MLETSVAYNQKCLADIEFGKGYEGYEGYEGYDGYVGYGTSQTHDIEFCKNYNEWGVTPGKSERSIAANLKSYPLSDDIKNMADVVFKQMKYRVRRGKIRQKLYFYCVYCAHLELGLSVVPVQLGAMFGLTPGDVQKCDSLFSPLQTGYRPPSANISPLRYLPDYCKEMNFSEETIDSIMKMASKILEKDITLLQEHPQTVAAGFLRYFTTTLGIANEDPQKLMKITSRSSVTIDTIYKRIAAVDNS